MARMVVIGSPVQVLLVQKAGVVSAGQRREAIEAMVRRALELRCFRILVDYRQAHAFAHDRAGSERVADVIASAFRGRDAKIAMLVRYDHQLDDALERQLTARGVATHRFHGFDDALDWLQSEQRLPAHMDMDMDRQAPHSGAGRPDPVEIAVRAVDPARPLLPSQFATVVHLVADLLGEGLHESDIGPLARRMASALRDQPGPR